MNDRDSIELFKLRGQIQGMQDQVETIKNFLEELADTLLEEKDYYEAQRMVAIVTGRDVPRHEEEEE